MGFGHRNWVVLKCPNSGQRLGKWAATTFCTEIFIETPSDPAIRASTWSDYKHHNTAKILASIAPNGAFNFISETWGGRTSDVHLTRESKFYNILQPYDAVMADRGFTIAEDLLLHRADLFIPPGKRGQEQFTKADVQKTNTIANLRIFVEQAIRRLKTFRIIKNELPISLIGNLDSIVIVCAALCNLYKPLGNWPAAWQVTRFLFLLKM